MTKNKNALAELAERLKRRIAHHRYVYENQRQDDIKAQRIVAELAKVKLNGVGWPVRVELADAYENCRVIAKEGGAK